MIILVIIGSLALVARVALLPVFLTFGVAVACGRGLGWPGGLVAPERRAVAIEVTFQNVALAIGLGIAFSPFLARVVAAAILRGVVHLVFGSGLAITWNRIAPRQAGAANSLAV